MHHWELVLRVLFANEGPLEILTCIDSEDLHVHVCKCLTEADSLTSVERCPSVRVTLLTFWGEEERVFVIESLREELTWPLPLVLVVM